MLYLLKLYLIVFFLLNGIKVKTGFVRNKVRFLFYEGLVAPAIWSVIYHGYENKKNKLSGIQVVGGRPTSRF